MNLQKYFERLLVVAVFAALFFILTAMLLPFLIKGFDVDIDSRDWLLTNSIIQALLIFIVPSLCIARFLSRKPFAYLELNKAPGWLPLVGVLFAYLIGLPALNQIIYWNEQMVFPESWSSWAETMRQMEDNALESAAKMLNTPSFGGMIVNVLVIGLLTAFGEEIFFRGTLQTTVASQRWYHFSIWIVAIIFSVLHFQVFGFIPRLLLGAWFGYLLYWTKSVYVPIFAHFLNNAAVVLFTWLSFKGYSFNLDKIGVVEVGFPYPALVSALAIFIFLFCFKNFFFKTSSKRFQGENDMVLNG